MATRQVGDVHVADKVARTGQDLRRLFTHHDRVVHVVKQTDRRLIHIPDDIQGFYRRIEEVARVIYKGVERLQQEPDVSL